MADLRQALSFLRQNKATDASPTISTSPSHCNLSEKDNTLPIISQGLPQDDNEEFEDFDEIFKNCDVFEFSPININDRVDIEPSPLPPPPPTHSKTRSVSQTDWSLSSEPSCKRPLIQKPFHSTTTATNRFNTIPTTIAMPTLTSQTKSVTTTVSSSSATPLATPTLSRFGMSEQNVTPKRVIRKFPGPAGCLPPLDSIKRLNDTPAVSGVSSGGTPASTPLRKSHASVIYDHLDDQFDQLNGPWARMLSELDFNDPLTSALLNINIASVIRQASKKELPDGKVSHLCVLVKSVVISARSATAHLQDPTGEIHAAVHISVIEEYKDEFIDGCVAILRQMSVLSPSSRKHYLNITLDNIIRVYPPEQQTSRTSKSCIKLSSIEEEYRQKENQSSLLLLSSYGINSSTNDCRSSSSKNTTSISKGCSDTSSTSGCSISSSGVSSRSNCASVYTSNSIITASSNTTNACSTVLNQGQTATDIEDDFDAYFEGIDVSLLDF